MTNLLWLIRIIRITHPLWLISHDSYAMTHRYDSSAMTQPLWLIRVPLKTCNEWGLSLHFSVQTSQPTFQSMFQFCISVYVSVYVPVYISVCASVYQLFRLHFSLLTFQATFQPTFQLTFQSTFQLWLVTCSLKFLASVSTGISGKRENMLTRRENWNGSIETQGPTVVSI